MSEHRNRFTDSSLDELSKLMEDCQPGSMQSQAVEGEFLKRQTLSQIEAAIATKTTARATVISAVFVAIAAGAAVLTLIASVYKLSN